LLSASLKRTKRTVTESDQTVTSQIAVNADLNVAVSLLTLQPILTSYGIVMQCVDSSASAQNMNVDYLCDVCILRSFLLIELYDALKMEAESSSETIVSTHKSTHGKERRYEHIPKPVETIQTKLLYVLWNQPIATDRFIQWNKTDIALQDTKGTC
jgi:hypothetical protein